MLSLSDVCHVPGSELKAQCVYWLGVAARKQLHFDASQTAVLPCITLRLPLLSISCSPRLLIAHNISLLPPPSLFCCPAFRIPQGWPHRVFAPCAALWGRRGGCQAGG